MPGPSQEGKGTEDDRTVGRTIGQTDEYIQFAIMKAIDRLSPPTCPWNESMMNWRFVGSTHSMHF